MKLTGKKVAGGGKLPDSFRAGRLPELFAGFISGAVRKGNLPPGLGGGDPWHNELADLRKMSRGDLLFRLAEGGLFESGVFEVEVARAEQRASAEQRDEVGR